MPQMKKERLLLTTLIFVMSGCVTTSEQRLVTIADARVDKAKFIDIGEPGDSVGDLLTAIPRLFSILSKRDQAIVPQQVR